jgi:hypothetical protein
MLKNLVAFIGLIAFCGCASMSNAERNELKELKCEKLTHQLISIQSSSSKVALASLISALQAKGFPDYLVSPMLDLAQSDEAPNEVTQKYKVIIDELMISILDNSGCFDGLKEKMKDQKSHKIEIENTQSS